MCDKNNQSMVDEWNNLRHQYDAEFVRVDAFHDYQKVLVDFSLLHQLWLFYRSHQRPDAGFTRIEYALKNEADGRFDQSMFDQIFPLLKESFDQLMQMQFGGLKFIHSMNKDVVYLLEKYGTEIYGGFAPFTDEEIVEKLLRDGDRSKPIVVCGVMKLINRASK